MHLLLLEPYFGGSHRHLAEGLAARWPGPTTLWTLPARKWKWRLRGAALAFADRFRRETPEPDVIFASSFVHVAELRGLLPAEARRIPTVLYFHENQLTYPVRHESERDYHYPWSQALSAISADRVLWNTAHNRDAFLKALPAFLRRMPDAPPEDLPRRIAEGSEVLPVPIDAAELTRRAALAPPRQGPPRILWNHRWEHDKGPARFFGALRQMAEEGIPFEVAVLGEQFRDAPPCFEEARCTLGSRIVAFGHVPDREDYLAHLCRADLVVSTAEHEFQGLAILEAAACGAVPLVPDHLAYPEIWPPETRYPPGDASFLAALRDRLRRIDELRQRNLSDVARAFDWEPLLPRYVQALRDAGAAAPETR